MSNIKDKIYSVKSLKQVIAGWKLKGQKIVFTNGCFDILHQGHIDYLEKAANKGNRLVIGVNTDASVQKLKGKTRPIQDENSRAIILAALHFVDAVILFDEDTPLELITELKPAILVKGADYKINEIVGSEIVLKMGGTVETIEYLDGFSTSNIEEKIILNNKSVN